MLRTKVDQILEYRNITRALMVFGIVLVLASCALDQRILTASLVILLLSLPLTLIIAIRTEKIAHASEFKRTWTDWLMEQTNTILLIAGIVVFGYGLTVGILFGLWISVIYVAVISLSMTLSWPVVRIFNNSKSISS